MRFPRSAGLTLLVSLLICAPCYVYSQASPNELQRSYPYSEAEVKQALVQLGAYVGGRLPMIDGFIVADSANPDLYQHPYYQYRIDLTAIDATHARLSLRARISAWYADPVASHAGYRSLASSGRLESDLFDRLEEALNPRQATATSAMNSATSIASKPTVTPAASDLAAENDQATAPAGSSELVRIRDDRKYVDQRIRDLSGQITQMEEALRSQAEASSKVADVKRSGTAVMTRMSDGGPVLFRARAQDEFEVVQQQGEWSLIKVGGEAAGWIRTEQLAFPASAEEHAAASSADAPVTTEAKEDPTAPAAAAANPASFADLGFWVSREATDTFRGDWEPLKDRRVLFVFVQPRSVLADVAHDDRKLKFIRQVFADPKRTSTLVRDNLAGVVIIFLGGKSAVAAASLSDMKQWARGTLNDTAFFSRCSLDPPEEFAATPAVAAGINGQ